MTLIFNYHIQIYILSFFNVKFMQYKPFKLCFKLNHKFNTENSCIDRIKIWIDILTDLVKSILQIIYFSDIQGSVHHLSYLMYQSTKSNYENFGIPGNPQK